MSNKKFRRYVNANKILYLKMEDVIAFLEMYESNNNNYGSPQYLL